MQKHFAVITGIAMVAVAVVVVLQTQGTDVRGFIQSGLGGSPSGPESCIPNYEFWCQNDVSGGGNCCLTGSTCYPSTGSCDEPNIPPPQGPPPPPSDECQGKPDGTACTVGTFGTFGTIPGICTGGACVENPPSPPVCPPPYDPSETQICHKPDGSLFCCSTDEQECTDQNRVTCISPGPPIETQCCATGETCNAEGQCAAMASSSSSKTSLSSSRTSLLCPPHDDPTEKKVCHMPDGTEFCCSTDENACAKSDREMCINLGPPVETTCCSTQQSCIKGVCR